VHALSRTISGLGLVLVPGAALALGALLAENPSAAIAVAALVAVVLLLLVRGRLLWWDLLLFALGGSLLFDYGFANIGVPGGTLTPLIDVIIVVVLAGLLLVAGREQVRLPLYPFVLAAGFIVLAAARLAVDYGVWGTPALRDFTLAVELGFLFIGYLAMRLYGLDRWVRALAWLFLATLVYFSMYPWREELASFGPTVGLQHPVPLLGTFRAAGLTAAAGLFFFALVRPWGRRSYLLAAAFLPIIALNQSRGLYLTLPVVIVLLWWLMRHSRTRVMRKDLALVLGVGVAMVLVVMVVAPAGRLGPVTPSFLAAQLGTLAGGEGPSAGTYERRAEWFRTALEEPLKTPSGVAFGVGLGPDLAGGLVSYDGELIRKPHNDYLEIFARFGVVGLTLFLLLLAASFRTIVGGLRTATEQEGRFLLWTVAVSTIVMLVATTQPVLAYTFGTMPLFLTLGAGIGMAEEIVRRQRPHDA
jgi:O-antigen ligase